MDHLKKFGSLLKPTIIREEEITERVIALTEEIIENGQTHGRTKEELVRHVRSGVIIELGTLKCLGGRFNQKKFDHKDPSSYMNDIETEGFLIEVKKASKGDSWLNFNVKGAGNANDYQLTRADYSVFRKWCQDLDFLVVGYYEELKEGYLVSFKWIIDAPSFKSYEKRSQQSFSGKGTTHYYDIRNAISHGNCISLKA